MTPSKRDPDPDRRRPESIEDYVARVVAELPPLTDAQCERVASLLRPWVRRPSAGDSK